MLLIQQAPQFGTVVLHADGGFTYTPKQHWLGEIDRFVVADPDRGLLAIRIVYQEKPCEIRGCGAGRAPELCGQPTGDRTAVLR